MKALILAAFTALVLSFGSNAGASQYHTPGHNFYQNNWMGHG